VKRRADRLLHGLGDVYAHAAGVGLAERLTELAPQGDARVYFAVSGADAVEIALKTGRLHSGRPEILAFRPAYHGTTLGALAASSRPAFRQPFTAPLDPLVHRLPHGAPAEAIRAVLYEQPGIGTCLVEPVVGREATKWPPRGWLRVLGDLCREYGVVLAVDEIFTGFGRCGEWFVSRAIGAEPDLICCGKALGGGLPIAAVIGRKDVMDCWQSDGEARHTATFVAHPLVCRSACATIAVLQAAGLLERARRMGERLRRALAPLGKRSIIAEVRGAGLLWAIELKSAALAAVLTCNLRQRGLIALSGGDGGTVLQIAPPLVITEWQLDYAAASLIKAVEELDRVAPG